MTIKLFRSNFPKIIFAHILTVGSTMLFGSMLLSPPVFGAEELNALVWCDHADPNLLKPFEEANNVKVNVKEYEGTGTGLTIVEQSKPGDWDLMVIDSIDVRRAVEKGLFSPLPDAELPLSDMFPEIVLDAQTKFDGKRYAVTEKFGYVAIGFNGEKVKRDELQHMSALWEPKFKGRIALYDYYLPMIGLVAMGLGKKTADLKGDDLPAIKDALLKMKANARMTGEITASQTALATGEVDVLVGGGEFVTAGLRKDNPAMEFTLPQEGGILWSQALGVFADSKKKDLALKFVKYVMSPEGQERLATASCFWGMPANRKAKLSDDEKGSLRFDEQPQFLARSQLAPAPDAELDKKMQDLWTEVLQSK
jgi:spermidine/putrescine transport system substrate-binding protein